MYAIRSYYEHIDAESRKELLTEGTDSDTRGGLSGARTFKYVAGIILRNNFV